MRKVIIILATVLAPALAHAGSLDNPWARPPVMEPPKPVLSWSGLYGGVGVTTQKKTTTYHDTIITEVPDGYERSCISGGSGHSDQKCQISQEDWESLDLREVKSPWNKDGLRNDGTPGEIVKYKAGYYGIWLNDQPEFTFSTDSINNPNGSRGATLGDPIQTFEEVIEDIFTLGEDEEITGNVFAGYRQVFSGFGVGLEAGLVGGLEAQAGISSGRFFGYMGANTDEEFTIGADVLMGETGSWFVGAKAANGTDSRGELRVGFKF